MVDSDAVANAANDTVSSALKRQRACAECRRSKLKCDRLIPCNACVKRGFPTLCPHGSVGTINNDKALVEQTHVLKERIAFMKSTVKELENSISEVNLNRASLDSEYEPSSLRVASIGEDGLVKYLGATAASDVLNPLLPGSLENKPEGSHRQGFYLNHPELPLEVVELISGFPLGNQTHSYSKSIFVPFIPPRDTALSWSNLFFESISWCYEPITRADYMENIFEPLYSQPIESIHAHRIGVFFSLIAFGVATHPGKMASQVSERLHLLYKASLAFTPVTVEPTVWWVQAAFLGIHMVYTFQHDPEVTWAGIGLTIRIASTIALERDSSRCTQEDEDHRRRRVFWELFMTDQSFGIMYGRPPALHIDDIGCGFPPLSSSETTDDLLGYHAWKFRYAVHCRKALTNHFFHVRKNPYSTILELDNKIQSFTIPLTFQTTTCASFSDDPATAMQQFGVISFIYGDLLCLHRSYLREALRSQPLNPLQHIFAPSVLAAFRSSLRIISGCKALMTKHALFAYRFRFFWSFVFSSCIVLGGIVVESPLGPLAEKSLRELDVGVGLYSEGAMDCKQPSTLESLKNIHKRAHWVYQAARDRNGFIHTGQSPFVADELDVLGARSGVIVSKSLLSRPVPPSRLL